MSAPSYAREREDFIAQMQAEGMPPEIARRILRHANTIQRLSAAECNGDYPCDNGERKVEWCARCEAGYVRSSMVRDHTNPVLDAKGLHALICPNCRAQDLIAQWCNKSTVSAGGTLWKEAGFPPFVPVFSGDPRGACVKLRVPSGKTDDLAREGICVPTRRY